MLYGDGIHDDTLELQKLIDCGGRCVRIPMAETSYLISRPLVVHAKQQLVFDRFCTIRLADGSNCHMLENEGYRSGKTDEDIEITGGIWDVNNMGQVQNPFLYPHPQCPEYDGIGIFMKNALRLRISGLTVKDTVTFAITLNIVKYFTVEDIDFDFNHGNNWAINMDGVHLDGQCRFGVIRNIKGTCYDDMIALNADEGEPGPILDIQVDGLFAEDCHSAVRLYACSQVIDRVSISRVYGTYFQYCIGITKYLPDPAEGYFGSLVLSEIYASKAPRYTVYMKDGTFVYPFLWVERNLLVKNLHIHDVYREEHNIAIPTLTVDPLAHVENLVFENIVQDNRMEEPIPVLHNQGTIDRLKIRSVRPHRDRVLKNEGVIGCLDADDSIAGDKE